MTKPDYAWLLQDLDVGPDHGLVFTEEHLAMQAAEKIVGNRSPALWADGYLYGPGDGTTRVMLRHLPKTLIQQMGYDIPLA